MQITAGDWYLDSVDLPENEKCSPVFVKLYDGAVTDIYTLNTRVNISDVTMGSSIDNTQISESEETILTPEEIKKANDESGIVPKLEKANAELDSALTYGKFQRAHTEIVEDIMNVVSKVIDDAANNKYVISEDTIAENYLELLKAVRDKYKNLSEDSKVDFKTAVSAIDPETFDFLEEFFQFDIDSI